MIIAESEPVPLSLSIDVNIGARHVSQSVAH